MENTGDVCKRKKVSPVRKMKKKIGCDLSSKRLAQKIIGCCVIRLSDMKPVFTNLFNLLRINRGQSARVEHWRTFYTLITL